MPEQLQSFEQQREALVEKLKLREQYETQFKTLNETGVLELLPGSQEIGIVDIKGQECPIPKYEEILAKITPEQLELLEQKAEQGFTKLLLVPFGLPLNVLTERYKQELLKHDADGTLLATDGTKLKLDQKEPFHLLGSYQNGDINGELVYDPREFIKKHQGRTKEELIIERGSWQISLIEDSTDLLTIGQGKTIAGRPQFEANKTPRDFLRLIQTDPQYLGEKGFYPECWIILAITTLHQKKQVIETGGKSCFLLGSYFKTASRVPLALWKDFDSRVCLLSYLPRFKSRFKNDHYSTRSLVEILPNK
jgi:hypothetical protein